MQDTDKIGFGRHKDKAVGEAAKDKQGAGWLLWIKSQDDFPKEWQEDLDKWIVDHMEELVAMKGAE